MATISCGRSRRCALLLASTLLTSGLSAPALAQSAGSISPPPVRQTVDENGVDVLRGHYLVSQTNVSIGGDNGGLDYRSFAYNGQWSDDEVATIDQSGSNVFVTVNGKSDGFSESGGVFTSTEGNGATLVASGPFYIYTARDGTVVQFAGNFGQLFGFWKASLGRVMSIVRPNGYREDFSYHEEDYCGSGWESGDCPSGVKQAWRLSQITNSNGYKLTFAYAYSGSELTLTSIKNWARITGVTATNLAASGSGASASASFSTTMDGSGNVTRTATDPLSRTTTFYKGAGYGTMTVTRPGSSSANVSVNYGSSTGMVSSVTNEGVSYSYSYSDSGTTRTTTVTDANGGSRVYVGDLTTYLLASYRDELNHTTSYTYDGSRRVIEITMPEGNKYKLSYDGRGNVTERRFVSKTPSTDADFVSTASYPSNCSNIVTCNKPTNSTDAKGNTTDYTYDSTHGGVLTITAPAPSSGAVRPQTRYTYATKSAYYDLFGGTPTGGIATYLPTAISTCQTTASCSGGSDEVKTTIDYGPQVTGTANNLLPVGVTTGAGDGSLTATVTTSYDAIGNRTYVDGPLSGAADTTRVLYDAARQVVGIIGPDPDGSGSLPNRAQRVTYNSSGQVTVTERGTTAGQSDSAWSGFSAAEKVTNAYDANARQTKAVLSNGGTDYGVTQMSYDALGRIECSAVRMNGATWGSLPSSACSLGTTGSYGPDRIGKTTYDAASHVTKVQSAFGTSEQSDEVTTTYNPNGTTATLTDGNGNKTTSEYDGFDRLSKTRMPDPSTSGTSSTTDYTQATYDANGNVTQMRLRDAQTIGYAYDDLNRLIGKDRPNSGIWDTDYTYAYDLLGRLTTATHVHLYSMTYSFVYDALDRKTGESNNHYYTGNLTYAYDLAGRRTRTTWNDGLYVDYIRLVTGEVSAIRENGATSGAGVLGSYNYDNLGRLSTLTRGNGVVTSYGYDAVSRLTSLAHDLAGSTYDVTTTLTYNPAGQISSSSRNNDAYAWGGHANVDRAYGVNGLNQLTASGSVSLGYDGKGNLNSSGSSSYTYSSENELLASPGASYAYNPFGLLYGENISGGTDTTFQYDGAQITTESDGTTSGTMRRRYAYGPGTDDPLVLYEGSGTSDRRWLIPDERGSVVAVTNGSGTATNINSYDEYGIPASTNVGRFGYTRQAWLPELGMWYYKARIYSPNLGRFMQTDPIGYGSGMNIYGYVSGDPVNLVDPLGLASLPSKDADYKPYDPQVVEGPTIFVNGKSCGSFCYSITDPGDISRLIQQITVIWKMTNSETSGGSSSAQAPQNNEGCKRPYSPIDMASANAIAIATTGQSPNVSPLSSEFSKLDALPNLSPAAGWRSAYTPHASGGGFEHDLPGGSGMVVKIYVGDTDHGGANTVTITSPTWSLMHMMEQFDYYTGQNINETHAKKFIKGVGGC